jgi:hypothetical protein
MKQHTKSIKATQQQTNSNEHFETMKAMLRMMVLYNRAANTTSTRFESYTLQRTTFLSSVSVHLAPQPNDLPQATQQLG